MGDISPVTPVRASVIHIGLIQTLHISPATLTRLMEGHSSLPRVLTRVSHIFKPSSSGSKCWELFEAYSSCVDPAQSRVESHLEKTPTLTP